MIVERVQIFGQGVKDTKYCVSRGLTAGRITLFKEATEGTL